MAKVLLVEDDNNLREIYEARLQAEGYEIASAQDGEQALVVAKQFKPDLVISDVMMPKISGFEMLDILRNTEGLQHTRVIMLTALGQAEDKTRADSLGADRYLVKSQVTLEDIVKSAHEILDGDTGPAPLQATTPQPVAETAAPAAAAVDVVPAPEMVAAPAEPAAALNTTPTAEPMVVAEPPVAAPAVPQTDVAAPDNVVASEVTPAPEEQPQAVPAPVSETVNQASPAVIPEPVAETTPSVAAPSEPSIVTPEPTAESVTPVPVDAPAPETTPAVQVAPQEPTTGADAAESQASDAVNAAAGDNSASVANEKQAINQQIEDFINNSAPADNAPATTVEPTDDQITTDDQLLAEAADSLSDDPTSSSAAEPAAPVTPVVSEAPAPPVATPPTTSAPAPTIVSQQDAPNDGVTISGKRVIQPIGDTSKPDLNELLAREEAKEAGLNPAPVATSSTAYEGVDAPMPPHQPGQAFSPQQSTDETATQNLPPKTDDFNPHDIAL